MPDGNPFVELVEIMARLRSADGCPWDREQTHASLKPYLLEEAYEVLEAIESLGPVTAESLVAETVIIGPLPRIGENLVGLVDLLELLLSIGTFVAIRMKFKCLFPKRFFYIFV